MLKEDVSSVACLQLLCVVNVYLRCLLSRTIFFYRTGSIIGVKTGHLVENTATGGVPASMVLLVNGKRFMVIR